MEIRKLECFLKVCETGSISGASEQLYISQQGISRIISSLEKELGTVLFIRSRQGVSLTADGLILKKYASSICRSSNALFRELASPHEQQITLAVTPGILFMYWDFLHELEKDSVKLTELYDYQCDNAVKTGLAQMSIGVAPVNEKLFDSMPLARHPLYVICREEHPLASKAALTFEDLADVHLIIHGRRYKGNREIMKTLKQKKMDDIRISETDNAVNMYKRCQDTDCAAITVLFPNSSFSRFHCIAIPLEEELFWEPCLIYPKGKTLTEKEIDVKKEILENMRT